jgi:hypothetical protein
MTRWLAGVAVKAKTIIIRARLVMNDPFTREADGSLIFAIRVALMTMAEVTNPLHRVTPSSQSAVLYAPSLAT